MEPQLRTSSPAASGIVQPSFNIKAGLYLGALSATLPFFLYFSRIKKLFWFGDEFALLHELRLFGFGKWLLHPFGENIVPLFKIIWSGLIFFFQGWYFPLIVALWIAHLLLLIQFGKILLLFRFPAVLVPIVLALTGLCWSQNNLLCFSYHLSAGLCLFFGFTGFLYANRLKDLSWLSATLYVALLFCAVFSFSRGFVLCLAFGLTFLASGRLHGNRQHTLLGLISFVPALFLLIALYFAGRIGSHGPPLNLERGFEMLRYGAFYFALSPLQGLLRIPAEQSLELSPVLLLGGFKLIVAGIAIRLAFRRFTQLGLLFVLLLAINIGDSVLLGFGRFTEGEITALSPRYQRIALITFVPLLVFLAHTLMQKIQIRSLRQGGAILLLAFVFWYITTPWGAVLYHHSKWQGRQGRRVMIERRLTPKETKKTLPWHGIPPVITYDDAKKVVDIFHLH